MIETLPFLALCIGMILLGVAIGYVIGRGRE